MVTYTTFHNLAIAVANNEKSTVDSILGGMSQDDQVQTLTRTNHGMFSGPMPLYTIMMRRPSFTTLFKHLQHERWPEVISVISDGNTCLTEYLEWGLERDFIIDFLSGLHPVLYNKIVHVQNCRGDSVHSLLIRP